MAQETRNIDVLLAFDRNFGMEQPVEECDECGIAPVQGDQLRDVVRRIGRK